MYQTLFLQANNKPTMVIFINDIPVKIKEASTYASKRYTTIVTEKEQLKTIKEWKGKVLIPQGDHAMISSFFKAIKSIKYFEFKKLTILVKDVEKAQKSIFENYRIVDAAGGVILNNKHQLLMIHRLGKWDLPKGKAEKGETIKQTAEREVEEECQVTVKVLDDYYVSYHTYLHKNYRVLKRTFWYKMKLVSDKNMAPQLEENIDEIKWKNRSQMHKALENSYASIRYVLNQLLSQELSFSKG